MTGPIRGDDDHRPLPINIEHYSTDGIPDAQRHAVWTTTAWPSVAAVFESQALAAFSTEADMVSLDQIFLQYARSTPREIERTLERAEADGIDALGIGIQLDGGEMVGSTDYRSFIVPEGAMLLIDTTRPCRIVHPAGASIQIALPRSLAQSFLGPLGPLHGVVVPPDTAAMLIGHLLQLRRALPTMQIGQQTILMRTVLDLIAVALGRQAIVELPKPIDADASASQIDRRARAEIEQRLGLPSLSTASLCQRLGVSRSTLFRLFKDDGGVQTYIRRRRLERVRMALAEPLRGDSVSNLAYRFGFSDSSHLTRLFKATYGETPTAFRAASRTLPVAR